MKPLKRRTLGNESTSWLSMKLPRKLHERIREKAFKEGKTISLLITEALEMYLK